MSRHRPPIAPEGNSRVPGPGIAGAQRRAHADDSSDEAGDQALDFLRKCHHMERLLKLQERPGCLPEAAPAWVLAFCDDGDPVFAVLEWLEAGWKDPVLVDAALRLCGTRALAEACMDAIGHDVGISYNPGVIARLATEMAAQSDSSLPP